MDQSRASGLASLLGSSSPVYVGCQHYTLARLLTIAILDYLQTSDWVNVEVARDLFGSVWDVVLRKMLPLTNRPNDSQQLPLIR